MLRAHGREVSRLERVLENPTVALLDRLAKALSAHIAAFIIEPKRGGSTATIARRSTFATPVPGKRKSAS
jgi:transcriptional regulator with XRE-family HTH domain